MPSTNDLQPADPHAIGEYQVLARLGAGSQGVVYLALAPSGVRVAIKQLISGAENERNRRQFAKEVAAARLVAPFCTAQLVDVQLEGPAPYVVSEYIEGPSLQQKVAQDGPMSGVALQRMAIGTATALVAIHQVGVVHRDFKPANVMLSADGPRVIDFGIARNLSTETTITSRIFGTPAYMSPEQLRNEPVDAAADMFAWASVITYAATGHTPFTADHMMAVAYRITTGEPTLTGVPASLLPVLEACLVKDSSQRPTAQEVLALLLGRTETDDGPANPAPLLAAGIRIAESDASLPQPSALRRRPGSGRTGTTWRRAAVAGVLVSALAAAGWGAIRTGWFERSAGQDRPDLVAAAPITNHSGPAEEGTGSASVTPSAAESTDRAATPSPGPTKARQATSAPKPSRSTAKPRLESPTLPPSALGTGAIVGLDGMCLDVANARSDNGTVVQVAVCNQSQAQIWTARADGTIRALGKCLNVVDGAVEINECDGTGDQKWRIASGTVVNTGSGFCLATLAGQSADRTPAIITSCTRTKSQSWSLLT